MNALQRIAAIAILSAGGLAGAARGEPAGDEPPPAPPGGGVTAVGLLRAALDVLPREPIALEGSLTVRRQRGVVLAQHDFAMRLDWGAAVPTATYELRDALGRTLQRLTVRRPETGLERAYETGSPLTNATPPTLAARVEGTDVTWLDLTLDFLWWRDARIEGEERKRGRDCLVVIAKPPAPIPGCSAVRLWLDRQAAFLLQAEQLDPLGDPTRRMWVDSLKKRHDRWFIRDMEIEDLKGDHRTRLHVENWAEQ